MYKRQLVNIAFARIDATVMASGSEKAVSTTERISGVDIHRKYASRSMREENSTMASETAMAKRIPMVLAATGGTTSSISCCNEGMVQLIA